MLLLICESVLKQKLASHILFLHSYLLVRPLYAEQEEQWYDDGLDEFPCQ